MSETARASRTLSDAVVAVVGATGGLGRCVVAALEQRGARPIRVGHRAADPSAAAPVPDLIGDLRDAGFGATIAGFAADRHGRLDGVVNVAGIVAFGEHVDTDPVVLEEVFLVNALGPLWLARGVADSLAATSGFFVNISGVVAEAPYPGMVAYVASKSAVSAGVRSLAREWRRRRILVVDARPPHTETGLATRPLAGVAPRFPQGLDPHGVAERVVAAVEAGETEVPSTAFT